MGIKYCISCKNVRLYSDFYKKLSRKCNLQSYCKICHDLKTKDNKLKNVERTKTTALNYEKLNKEKIKKRKQLYNKKRYDSNPELFRKRSKDYKLRNPEKIKEYDRKHDKLKRQTDIKYKLVVNLRNRLRIALKNQLAGKRKKTLEYLGCTLEELKVHLESQFKEGMTWNNHGLKGWHIDHIIPLSKFDLTIEDHLEKACHYTNLQPMWSVDNIKKSNKI